MPSDDIHHLIEVANEMADAARSAILPFFRGNKLNTESKLSGGFDPVTVADRAGEEAMRAVLAQRRPEDGILGEEFGAQAGTSGLTWVLDPIDGTRGFISGTPTWGILIALSDENGPKLGVIDQPYIGERFIGAKGHLAQLYGPQGNRGLSTRQNDDLSDAIVFTTFPEVGSKEERTGFLRVSAQVKLTRYGMDCYAYALLAAGQIDLVIEAGLNTYDIQGPIGVIEAAGGIVTNWQGGPAHQGGRAIAASNSRIHAQALALLSNA